MSRVARIGALSQCVKTLSACASAMLALQKAMTYVAAHSSQTRPHCLFSDHELCCIEQNWVSCASVIGGRVSRVSVVVYSSRQHRLSVSGRSCSSLFSLRRLCLPAPLAPRANMRARGCCWRCVRLQLFTIHIQILRIYTVYSIYIVYIWIYMVYMVHVLVQNSA